ncbi:MAG: hypothetical protein K9N48_01080 [Verrucomicrobia bacterium]|nr:hypothetical protein [Verrucomicrobiota bacterium]
MQIYKNILYIIILLVTWHYYIGSQSDASRNIITYNEVARKFRPLPLSKNAEMGKEAYCKYGCIMCHGEKSVMENRSMGRNINIYNSNKNKSVSWYYEKIYSHKNIMDRMPYKAYINVCITNNNRVYRANSNITRIVQYLREKNSYDE